MAQPVKLPMHCILTSEPFQTAFYCMSLTTQIVHSLGHSGHDKALGIRDMSSSCEKQSHPSKSLTHDRPLWQQSSVLVGDGKQVLLQTADTHLKCAS